MTSRRSLAVATGRVRCHSADHVDAAWTVLVLTLPPGHHSATIESHRPWPFLSLVAVAAPHRDWWWFRCASRVQPRSAM